MRPIRPLAVVLLALAATLAIRCAAPQPPAAGPAWRLADEYLAAMLERYPETATYYGIPGHAHDRLTDNGRAARDAWQEREDAWLARLETLPGGASAGSPEWAIRGILEETLRASIGERICRSELWDVSQAAGWQTQLPYLFEIQPVGSAELRAQALARAAAVPGFLATEIANLREGLGLGYSATRRSVELTLDQVRALGEPGSPFESPARRDADSAFRAAWAARLTSDVRPALERYVAFLEDEYLPAARSEIAVTANPDGAACYRALVRYHSTLEVPAREIHELGLERMARISEEMLEIARRSFDTDDLPTLLRRLTTDPELAFASSDEIIAFSQAAVERARSAMPRYFGRLPKGDLVIEPYPAYLADTGTGEYQSGSEDGSRPGIYYIPVTDPTHRPRVIYESLAFHETIPGHHLQGALALELGGDVHPLARYLYNSGYAEGWALYSERLADEMGLYSSDLTRMGMLGDQAARAARLVIDPGLHVLGWSRQQAIDYMTTHTTWPAADIEAEIDRYIDWPGQATSYMLGMLEIQRLRARAEEALGDSFSLAGFHDRVLGAGSLPLGMLEESIDAWVAAPD